MTLADEDHNTGVVETDTEGRMPDVLNSFVGIQSTNESIPFDVMRAVAGTEVDVAVANRVTTDARSNNFNNNNNNTPMLLTRELNHIALHSDGPTTANNSTNPLVLLSRELGDSSNISKRNTSNPPVLLTRESTESNNLSILNRSSNDRGSDACDDMNNTPNESWEGPDSTTPLLLPPTPMLPCSPRGSTRGRAGVGNRLRSLSASFILGEQHALNANERKLGVLAVFMVAYFNVCGGPMGSEPIVSAAGPLPGFLGILAFSFLWAVPISCITSELSSAFPDDGGYSIWATEAFGNFWGYQEMFWSWCSGVSDSAVYPILAYSACLQIINGAAADPLLLSNADGNDTAETLTFNPPFLVGYFIKLVLLLVFSLPNLLCLRTIGYSLSFLAIMVLLPYGIYMVLALASANEDTFQWSRLLKTRPDTPVFGQDEGWFYLISVLYWSFSGFDSVSTCAGEVRDASKVYPRALALAVAAVALTYLTVLPVATVVGGNPSWMDWDEGSLPLIASNQVGPWMAVCLLVSTLIANAAMFSAQVFEDSWQLRGGAEEGLAPKYFASRHVSYDTPWRAIWFGNFVIGLLVAFDFSAILCVSNFFGVASMVLEMCSFIKLRFTLPQLERPFRVPIRSKFGLVLMLVPPMCIAVLVVLSSLLNNVSTLPLIVFSFVLGGVLATMWSKNGGGSDRVRQDQSSREVVVET